MNRRQQDATPARGLFRNGNLWWMRVRDPLTKKEKRRSTGTDSVEVANAIVNMLSELAQDRANGWEWLTAVVQGRVTLLDVYNYRVRSALHELRTTLEAKTEEAIDDDLRQWAARWISEVLPTRVTRRKRPLGERQRADCARQLRALIPDDEPTLCSQLTEEFVIAALHEREAAPNTLRNYASTWRMFVRWARRKGAPIPTDPFEYAEDWLPGPGKARSKVWSHAERLRVLAELNGSAKAAIALMLGSGMELSALLRLRGVDVSRDGSRTVFADGRKTDFRSRFVTVDEWAWTIFSENVQHAIGAAKVFPWTETSKGQALRETFYAAQVRAGLCEKPPESDDGYSLWRRVDVHRIHDCRHTFAVCRGLGLDGEAAQGNEYLAAQLGHANEAMVQRVYKNLDPARRRQLLAEAEKLRQARHAA
jgi:integrase